MVALIVLLFLTKGASTSMGWYMYAVIGAEVVLCCLGLRALLPQHLSAWVHSKDSSAIRRLTS